MPRSRTAQPRGRALQAAVALAIATSSHGAYAQLRQAPLTIEQIASAPFPFGMVAAPTGGAVAWVYNDRGVRNVWVAEPGAGGRYVARRVTDYAGDDGMDIAGLTWSGDGRALVYTRGGDRGGAVPVNPTSAAAGARPGELWSVPAGGGAPTRIGVGTMASAVPGSNRIIFLRGGQPFVATPGGEAPAPLFADRGRITRLSWSPDGSRLAFVSDRGQHALIGVFTLATRMVTWMAPGIDRDSQPTWSPDGARIAFVRSASGDDRPQGLAREGIPWEIHVADVATGAGRRLWQAAPGTGSRFRALFNSDTSLFWVAGDRLVFPWEATGWVRLYAISAGGGTATMLTPGESEVFATELTPDRSALVYATNQGDIDRRHIWRVPVGGGAPAQLTRGTGIEDFPVITADGRVFAVSGQPRVPLQPVLVGDRGVEPLAPEQLPRDFPSARLVEPELVTFTAADGKTVHGQLFVPRGLKGKAPALLFFHGGPTNRQAFGAWDSFETHSHLYEANQYLAASGYIVLSVNFRGGSGYGLDFREATGFGATGASELNDIVGAARYLRGRVDVDAGRMGVWGGSYGGRMASLALARAPEYFAVGVDYAGVHDLGGARLRGGDEAAARIARDSSAIGHVDSWRAPVLLMVGDADDLLPQTIDLAASLRRRGVPVETMMLPDEVHFLLRHESWNRIFRATRAYLDRFLKP